MRLRACFFGLGSIGRRHLRNFCDLAREMNIEICVDALRTRKGYSRNATPALPAVREYENIADIDEHYDIAFITNPTYLHFQTLKDILSRVDHIYIEKPLFESSQRHFREIPWKEGHIYHIACPLRRDPGVQHLKRIKARPLSARIICSSYLPDWRPGTDYTVGYSAWNTQGGGVWRDLIHEWDYVRFVWGDPLRVSSFKRKVSTLPIHSDDIAVYLADFGDFAAEIHLDYFGRIPRRYAEVFYEDDVMKVDILSRQVHYLRSGETIALPESDNHYEDLRFFLKAILNGEESDNPPEFAWNSLRFAEEDMK